MAEIERLDASTDNNQEQEYYANRAKYLKYLDLFPCSRLALKFSDSQNNYVNNNLWSLECKKNSSFFSDPHIEDNSLIMEEQDLALCLACLEENQIILFEVEKLAPLANDDDHPDTYYGQLDKIHFEYATEIVSTCYKDGKFETDNWKIEITSKN